MHQNKQANVRQVHHNEIYMYAPKWFKLYILYALCGHIYLCNIVTQLLSLRSLHKCLFCLQTCYSQLAFCSCAVRWEILE